MRDRRAPANCMQLAESSRPEQTTRRKRTGQKSTARVWRAFPLCHAVFFFASPLRLPASLCHPRHTPKRKAHPTTTTTTKHPPVDDPETLGATPCPHNRIVGTLVNRGRVLKSQSLLDLVSQLFLVFLSPGTISSYLALPFSPSPALFLGPGIAHLSAVSVGQIYYEILITTAL